jgi:ankyrin repeat protein
VSSTLLDRVDHRGRNPWFECIDRGNVAIAELLVRKKCRLDQFDNDGVLPIQTVWLEGDGRGAKGEWEINPWVPTEIKELVVRYTPDDLLGEGFYKDGNSAHHYACMEGNKACVVGGPRCPPPRG